MPPQARVLHAFGSAASASASVPTRARFAMPLAEPFGCHDPPRFPLEHTTANDASRCRAWLTRPWDTPSPYCHPRHAYCMRLAVLLQRQPPCLPDRDSPCRLRSPSETIHKFLRFPLLILFSFLLTQAHACMARSHAVARSSSATPKGVTRATPWSKNAETPFGVSARR